MRYFFILLFLSGCADLQKAVTRDRNRFNERLNESINARNALSEYIKNPEAFDGWQADSIQSDANRIGSHQSTFEYLCKEGDQEACDELKLGREAIKAYDLKVVEVKKLKSDAKEAERHIEKNKYETEQREISERNQRFEAIGGNDLRNICIGEGNIKHFNRIIAEQKAIGNESGVVNQTALYQAGQGLITWRKILAESKVEYKKKMKKEFHPSVCALLEKR